MSIKNSPDYSLKYQRKHSKKLVSHTIRNVSIGSSAIALTDGLKEAEIGKQRNFLNLYSIFCKV